MKRSTRPRRSTWRSSRVVQQLGGELVGGGAPCDAAEHQQPALDTARQLALRAEVTRLELSRLHHY